MTKLQLHLMRFSVAVFWGGWAQGRGSLAGRLVTRQRSVNCDAEDERQGRRGGIRGPVRVPEDQLRDTGMALVPTRHPWRLHLRKLSLTCKWQGRHENSGLSIINLLFQKAYASVLGLVAVFREISGKFRGALLSPCFDLHFRLTRSSNGPSPLELTVFQPVSKRCQRASCERVGNQWGGT